RESGAAPLSPPAPPLRPGPLGWADHLAVTPPPPPAAAQIGTARGRPARIVSPVPWLPGLERASAAGRRGGPGRSSRTAPRALVTRNRVRPLSQADSTGSMSPYRSISHSARY